MIRRKLIWATVAFVTLVAGVCIDVALRHRGSASLLTNNQIDDAHVYINQDLKWEYFSKQMDPEAGGYRFTTNERVLMFFSDGTFASIKCVLQQPDGSNTPIFIPNNGFAVFKGTWRRNSDGTITLSARLVSSNKVSDDGIARGHQLLTETLVIRDIAADRTVRRLDVNGRAFVVGPKIDGLRELLSMPPGDI